MIENGYIDSSSTTLIPNAANNVNTANMYDIQSAPDPNLGNATFMVGVGNVVGGGSIVNGMMFHRASKADYDAWQTLGNFGWDWRGLLSYFKKSTTFTPPSKEHAQEWDITYDASYYGKDGPIHASYPPFEYPDMKNIWKAAKAADTTFPIEGASGEAVGAYWVPTALNPTTQTRSHSRNGYYDPIASRKNLHLLPGHRVNEILFNGLTANGVQMISRSTKKVTKVYARKEVILAAGAIFTPQLLQLSGLGPKAVLKAAGIKVKRDIPGIGANFQDHPAAFQLFALQNLSFPNPNSLLENATFNATAWQEYEVNKTGPYTQAHGSNFAFLSLPQITSSWRNIVSQIRAQHNPLSFLPPIYKKEPSLLLGYLAQRAIITSMLSGNDSAAAEIPLTSTGFSISALQHPLSRGTVYLDPKNPSGNPIVTYNTFQNPMDGKMLMAILRWTRTHFLRRELAMYAPTEIIPGAQFTNDEEMLQALVNAKFVMPSFSHASGSCAMMPEALGGVVDDQLRVYGVRGLRIVDASVLPLIPATHLQSTMFAVAEKGVEGIRRGR